MYPVNGTLLVYFHPDNKAVKTSTFSNPDLTHFLNRFQWVDHKVPSDRTREEAGGKLGEREILNEKRGH